MLDLYVRKLSWNPYLNNSLISSRTRSVCFLDMDFRFQRKVRTSGIAPENKILKFQEVR